MPTKRSKSKPKSDRGGVRRRGAEVARAGSSRASAGEGDAADQIVRAAQVTRLRRAEGQVRGIMKMIEQERPCADTIIQIAAAQESLRAVAKNLLKNHLKHCARAAFTLSQREADAMCSELMDVMSRIAR